MAMVPLGNYKISAPRGEDTGLSKLPGPDGQNGEKLNRHKKGRKRRNKRRGPANSEIRSEHDARNENRSNGSQTKRERRGNSPDSGPNQRSSLGNAERGTGFAASRNGDGSAGITARPRRRKNINRPADGAKGHDREADRDIGEHRHGGVHGERNHSIGGATSSGAGRSFKRNSRQGRKKPHSPQSDEAILARSLRAPVQKTPDAAYAPVVPDPPRAGNGAWRPASDHRRDEGDSTFGGRTSQQRQSARRRVEPYAALDLGTNNCRLLVALPQERGRFRVIDGFSRIVRLGEGLGSSDRLSDAAMDRALEALRICAEKLVGHNIRRHRLIATEACRQAINGSQFLERVHSETGMKLEIINRQTEAHLAAEGCSMLMDRKADAAVLFDIGGGSSELVLVDRRQRKARISEQIAAWTSLPVGVVTLAERHGGRDVNRKVFTDMVAEVRGHIDAFEGRDALGRLWSSGRVHLLGTSGTVTTLAGIHLGLPRYERRLVDGLWLDHGDIDRVINELIAMNYQQRAASPCIGVERADLVMAGCAILEAIRQTWPSKRLRVADRGLREGILTEMMERDAAWLPPKMNRKRRHPSQVRGNRSGQSNSNDSRDSRDR